MSFILFSSTGFAQIDLPLPTDSISPQQAQIGWELQKAGDHKMTSLKLKAISAGFGILACGVMVQENQDGTSGKSRMSDEIFIFSAALFTVSIPFDFLSAQHLRKGGFRMQGKPYVPHL